jgi:hypothetical protein
MVRQHYAACSDPDVAGPGCDITDYNRRRRAGYTGHVMMFRKPKALIAPTLSVLCEVQRVPERDGGARASRYESEIQNGEMRHSLHAASIASSLLHFHVPGHLQFRAGIHSVTKRFGNDRKGVKQRAPPDDFCCLARIGDIG